MFFLKPASVELYPSFCAAALSDRNLSHSGPSFRSRPICMALMHSSSKDGCFVRSASAYNIAWSEKAPEAPKAPKVPEAPEAPSPKGAEVSFFEV